MLLGILGLLLVVLLYAVSFLITAGLFWVVCWAFGLMFSWKVAVGIWVVLIVLKSIFKSNVNVQTKGRK